MLGNAALTVACVLMVGAQTERPPELPDVATTNFLPAIREQIESALRDARTHPDDAERAGRLGMTLQAYEQYGAAEQVYMRTHDLEPRNLYWLYLCGDAEMALGKFD